jgi:hypothetical protein
LLGKIVEKIKGKSREEALVELQLAKQDIDSAVKEMERDSEKWGVKAREHIIKGKADMAKDCASYRLTFENLAHNFGKLSGRMEVTIDLIRAGVGLDEALKALAGVAGTLQKTAPKLLSLIKPLERLRRVFALWGIKMDTIAKIGSEEALGIPSLTDKEVDKEVLRLTDEIIVEQGGVLSEEEKSNVEKVRGELAKAK